MKEITKERLRYIANDIETIEISKKTNIILGMALKRTINRNVSNEEYARFCMQEILKRNIYIHFDNSLKIVKIIACMLIARNLKNYKN